MKKILSLMAGLMIFYNIIYAQNDVIFETSEGNITLKLFPKVAPKACENFITLIKKGYYDSTTFHRVIKNFMIQGGDPTASGAGGESKWGKPFEDEYGLNIVFDRAGILAMANRGPNTNSSQFFITTKPTPWLNGRHTIFGEVIKGFNTISKIENAKTNSHDKPIKDITIIKAITR